ncbi:MAG: hypothetical protein H0Z24_09675 [Thermosipho sp. (in: Bacteria)]|nr:hypothetical protein [Thermosipho sp. (in: thermotogales)]
MKFSYKIIFLVLVVLIFIVGSWILTPSVKVIRAIPPTVIDSEVGERQAILIRIQNFRPFSIKITDACLNSDRGMHCMNSGIILEEGNTAYKFLSEGNPYWEKVELYSFEDIEIKGFGVANIYFMIYLDQKVGLIDNMVFSFKYLGREYLAIIDEIKLAVLAESASKELERVVRKFYPGHGYNIKHPVTIKRTN